MNITAIVGEVTDIVNRSKSLTFPCSSRVTLIFFSSGRCFSWCVLGACTACSETVGFPPGYSLVDHLNSSGYGRSNCSQSSSFTFRSPGQPRQSKKLQPITGQLRFSQSRSTTTVEETAVNYWPASVFAVQVNHDSRRNCSQLLASFGFRSPGQPRQSKKLQSITGQLRFSQSRSTTTVEETAVNYWPASVFAVQVNHDSRRNCSQLLASFGFRSPGQPRQSKKLQSITGQLRFSQSRSTTTVEETAVNYWPASVFAVQVNHDSRRNCSQLLASFVFAVQVNRFSTVNRETAVNYWPASVFAVQVNHDSRRNCSQLLASFGFRSPGQPRLSKKLQSITGQLRFSQSRLTTTVEETAVNYWPASVFAVQVNHDSRRNCSQLLASFGFRSPCQPSYKLLHTGGDPHASTVSVDRDCETQSWSASLPVAVSSTVPVDLDCKNRSWSATFLAAVFSTVLVNWDRETRSWSACLLAAARTTVSWG